MQRVGQLCAWAVNNRRDRWSDGALGRGGREKTRRTPTHGGANNWSTWYPLGEIQGVRPTGRWLGGRPVSGNGRKDAVPSLLTV